MVEVVSSGLWSSIQDTGRLDYRHIGVPVSGVMDSTSAERANMLLNNNLDDAVLEFTLIGPTLKFHTNTSIAITGARMSPLINEKSIQNNKVYHIVAGSVLKFGSLVSGARSYLAVDGGFKGEIVLGSQSFYRGITKKERIVKGDILPIVQNGTLAKTSKSNSRIRPKDFNSNILKAYRGPEYWQLNELRRGTLFKTEFSISKLFNRMAYQLEEGISNELSSLITSPVMPGTVQLTPNGQLIILMRDCQTTGGYPRILQLSENAINLLSQKKQNDSIRFKLIAN